MTNRTNVRQPLTALMTGATAAMIALTSCALYLVDHGSAPTAQPGRLWPMILAASCATLLVMSLLHSDLKRLYRVISEREKQSHSEARTDILTGLANRKSLLEAIELGLTSVGNAVHVLFLIDLDRFKHVNDTRGHEGGDELLTMISRRLEIAVPNALIARLGGDEFAILAKVPDSMGAEQLCIAALAIFDEPFELSRGGCLARGSVGAAVLEPQLTVSDVLRRADIAMYTAKTNRSRFRIFDRQMIEEVERRTRLAADLRRSVGPFEDFSAVYQPIVSGDGRLVALEALLRWKHPQFDAVAPQEIVEIAEEVQCINELGLFVAQQACRAACAMPEINVALNVSPVQLLDSRFREQFTKLVLAEGVATERIQIEIKESDFVSRGHDMADALRLLHESGFTVAVDDFGSSTSSLVQLQRFGVTALKLDPKVLRNARELENTAVMRAKVDLARALGMRVTCEGIGSEADRLAALKAGCDMLQGFLIGRPQSLQATLDVSRRRRAA